VSNETTRVLRAVPAPTDAPRADLEAERSVIGSVLLDNDALTEVEPLLAAVDFYYPAYALMYAAAIALHSRGEPIDIVTLSAELLAREQLNVVGGRQAIAELTDGTVTVAHVAQHARIISELAVTRRIGSAGQHITAAAKDPTIRLEQLAELASEQTLVASERRTSVDPVPLHEGLVEMCERIEAADKGIGTGIIVNSGLRDLDNATAGLRPGQLVVIGARPRVGKTAIAMQIAVNAAKSYYVLVFSLEMPRSELIDRMAASEARVDHGAMRRGKLTAEQMGKITEACESIYKLPLYIDDTAGLAVTEIRSRARRFARRHPELGLIVVDYLQLIKRPQHADTREEGVAENSRGLKALAKELGVPLIALAQLNRAGRDKPTLEHLRESGAIEADADIVALLHRDDLVNPNSAKRGVADVILAKQRSDASEVPIALRFTPSHLRFDNLQKDDEGVLPAGYDEDRLRAFNERGEREGDA